MARQISEKDKLLGEYAIKLGLTFKPETEQLEKELSPHLDALNRKLKMLDHSLDNNPLFSKSALSATLQGIKSVVSESGGLERSFLSLGDLLGSKMGLGKHWTTNTANLLKYATLSKGVKGANKELYESMGLVGKAAASAMAFIYKKDFKKLNKDKDEAGNEKKPDELKTPVEKVTDTTEAIKTQIIESSDKAVNHVSTSLESLKNDIIKTQEALDKLRDTSGTPIEPVEGTENPVANLTDSVDGAIPETVNAAENLSGAAEATKPLIEGIAGATKGMTGFGLATAAATAGITLIVAAIAAVGIALQKISAIAVSGRMEMKKFDQVFGGIGEIKLQGLRNELNRTNESISDLGFIAEKVNDSILEMASSGISFQRAASDSLNRTVMELHGVTGTSISNINSLYGDLIKKVSATDNTIKESANSLVGFNEKISQFADLGPISFDNFKESITSSSNALMIAQSRGDAFAKNMMKDLTTLTGLANSFGMSISELNNKFEEAGNIISSSSGFRDLLVIANGANIGNIMDNQFNKTEAMLKTMTYLQDLNKQFGNNINLTAQVAAQTYGMSKEMAMRLITTTASQQKHIKDMQKLMTDLKSDEVSKSYKEVTTNLIDSWEKVKASVINLFQRTITGSAGINRLQATFARIVEKIKDIINGPTLAKISKTITAGLDSVSGWIDKVVTKFESLISDVSDGKKGFWEGLWEGVKSLFSEVFDLLVAKGIQLGELIGDGIKKSFFGSGTRDGIRNALLLTGPLGWIARSFIKSTKEKEAEKNGLTNNPASNKADAAEKRAKEKAFWDGLKEDIKKTITGLNKEVSDRKAQLDQFQQVGAAGTDIVYGKRSNGEEGFMTVAEKQYLLQKEIEEREAKIAKEEADYRDLMAENIPKQTKSLGALADALLEGKIVNTPGTSNNQGSNSPKPQMSQPIMPNVRMR